MAPFGLAETLKEIKDIPEGIHHYGHDKDEVPEKVLK
jgi:hypothetical protein